VAYACNPSYSGGRDQEDGGLKPVQAVCETLSQKNLSHTHTHTHTHIKKKRAGGVVQGVSPEFKPQYLKKIK
jgi:hypothetical protein